MLLWTMLIMENNPNMLSAVQAAAPGISWPIFSPPSLHILIIVRAEAIILLVLYECLHKLWGRVFYGKSNEYFGEGCT